MFGELLSPWLWLAWSAIGVATLMKAFHFVAVSEQRLAEHL
jgi:hypothetical protein